MSRDPRSTIAVHRKAPRIPTAIALVIAVLLHTACGPSDPIAEIRDMHARGAYEASLEPLRELLEQQPDDVEVLYLYGTALIYLGQLTEAVWPLRRAMEDPDWYSKAALQLANISTLTTDWDMATQLLDALLEQEPENAQALLLRAYARAQSRQDYEGALADADAVIAQDASSSDALVLRAVALLGLQRIDEAGEAIEAASDHFEEAGLGLAESPRFCAVRATFAKEKKQLEKAEEIFDECLTRFPDHFFIVNEAAKFFDSIGRFDRSLEIVRDAHELAPAARSYRLSLVHRLDQAGEHEEAERLMVEATESKHAAVAANAFSDLAAYYFERERLEEAVSAFEQALARVPDPGPDFMFVYADTLVAAGHYDKALALAETMQIPSHRELVRGRVALERGDPEAALAHFAEGLRLWPANAVARYFAATAAEQLGDFDRAIEEYRYAIRADPGATDARLRLALLYRAKGDDTAALEVVRHDARQRGYDTEERALLEVELLARLDQGNSMPEHVLEVIRAPAVWGRAVAARARGMRARLGPQRSAKAVLGAARLDLTSPLNAAALESLVLDLIDLDRAGDAFARLDAALKAHPDTAAFHAIQGLALTRAHGDPEKARPAWDRAIALDPSNAAALRGLARLEAATGNTDAALGLYSRAAAADEQDTEALRESAELLAAGGQREEARAALESLLERDPYAGPDALRLARLMLEEESGRDDRRVLVLLRGAVQFGGGVEARELLERHSPTPGADPTQP